MSVNKGTSVGSLEVNDGVSVGAGGVNAAVAEIVTDGLVAEWRFDDGSGQQLTDYTANGNHGTLGSTGSSDTNDPTWTSEGLSFDSSDDFVEHGTLGISGSQNRTLCVVIKPISEGGTSPAFSIEWQGDGSTNFKRLTFMSRDDVGKLRCEVKGSGINSDLTTPDGEWAFMACRLNGTTINDVTLFLNGSSEALSGGSSTTLNTTGNFAWSKQDTSAVDTDTGPFDAAYGLVYNRALTDDEIEQNRRALKSKLSSRGIQL